MTESVVFAIDIGGKGVKTGIVDNSGLRIAFEPFSLPPHLDSHTFFSILRREITNHLSGQHGHLPEVIGIGIPGSMNRDTGVSFSTANLPWPPQTNFKELIETWTGLQTFVEHDVRSGAIAEAHFGALKGVEDFLYVAIGTGIGASICVRGKFYMGSSGFAGELGHTVVMPNGQPCGCGRLGCLEAYCSAKHIERQYRERTSLSQTCKQIAELVEHGDHVAKTIWSDATDALALALVNYHMLLQPQKIVIGGGVAQVGEALLLRPILAKMKDLAPTIPLPQIAFSELKQHSALIGAGYQAIIRHGGGTT